MRYFRMAGDMGPVIGGPAMDGRARRSRARVLPLLASGVLLGAVALGVFAHLATGGVMDRIAEFATGRPVRFDTSLPTIVNKIQRLQRLESVSYTMDKIVEGDRQSALLPDFLAGDKLLLISHGEVIAGIDMGQVTAADIHISGKRIEVHLPAAQILVARLDNAQTRVYSRVTGLLVPVDPNLESEVRSKAEDQLRQAALADGILDKARHNASLSVTAMLQGLGFEQVAVN